MLSSGKGGEKVQRNLLYSLYITFFCKYKITSKQKNKLKYLWSDFLLIQNHSSAIRDWLGKCFSQIWFWPLVLLSPQFWAICLAVSASHSLSFMMTPLRIITSLCEKYFHKMETITSFSMVFYRVDIVYNTNNSQVNNIYI